MNLAFSGTPEIRATRESVWQRLLDPHFLRTTDVAEVERVLGAGRVDQLGGMKRFAIACFEADRGKPEEERENQGKPDLFRHR